MVEHYIKNNWYKITCPTYKKAYFKYSHKIKSSSDGIRIHCHTLIWNSRLQNEGEADYFNNPEAEQSTILLTDLTEIQEFLPDGHPDKFTTIIKQKDYTYLIKLLKNIKHE